MRKILIACLFPLLAACAAPTSVFLPPGPPVTDSGDFSIPAPEDAIVLIYSQGTRSSARLPSCNKQRGAHPVWNELSGKEIAGKTVFVYYLCTNVTGASYIKGRAAEIETALDLFQSKGLHPSQLFLIGQSAGAWSSLVAARTVPEKFNAVIGVAPAFSGTRARRGVFWEHKRAQEVRALENQSELKALIFAFEDDAFNRPEDLSFMRSISGVELVALPWDEIDGVGCSSEKRRAHSTGYRPCFTKTQKGRIQSYIEQRLQGQSS